MPARFICDFKRTQYPHQDVLYIVTIDSVSPVIVIASPGSGECVSS
jgi:hypothetical protein